MSGMGLVTSSRLSGQAALLLMLYRLSWVRLRGLSRDREADKASVASWLGSPPTSETQSGDPFPARP